MQQLAGNVQGAVVRNGADGKLVLVDLPPPRSGRTYEAWLIGRDKKPVPAGHFKGGKAVVVGLDGNAAGREDRRDHGRARRRLEGADDEAVRQRARSPDSAYSRVSSSTATNGRLR